MVRRLQDLGLTSVQSWTARITISICVILKTPLTSLCLGFPIGGTVPTGLTVSDKLGYTHGTQHSTWPRDDHGEITGLAVSIGLYNNCTSVSLSRGLKTTGVLSTQGQICRCQTVLAVSKVSIPQ